MKYTCESRQYFGEKTRWGQRKALRVESREQAVLAYAAQIADAYDSTMQVRVRVCNSALWHTFAVRRGWYIEEESKWLEDI